MRIGYRIGILIAVTGLALSAPLARPTYGATGCAPLNGQVAVFEGLNYTGNCAIKGVGSYNTTQMGVGDNNIESVKIGPAASWSYRLMACTGAGFTGVCDGFKASGNLPDGTGEQLNFRNTISSFRVQRYDTTNNFSAPQCTWGAATRLFDYAAIYPGRTGNATDWDNNAATVGYLVNDTPSAGSIVNMEKGNVRVVAKSWSGAMNGGTPNIYSTSWHDNADFGHVAWLVDVWTASNGEKWIRTYETNVTISPTGWTTFLEHGVTFWTIWTRWTASDYDTMSVIHITQ